MKKEITIRVTGWNLLVIVMIILGIIVWPNLDLTVNKSETITATVQPTKSIEDYLMMCSKDRIDFEPNTSRDVEKKIENECLAVKDPGTKSYKGSEWNEKNKESHDYILFKLSEPTVVPTETPTKTPFSYSDEQRMKNCYRDMVAAMDAGEEDANQCWNNHEYWGDHVRIKKAIVQPFKYSEKGRIIYRAYCEYGDCANEIVTNTKHKVGLWSATGYVVYENEILWPATATPEPSPTPRATSIPKKYIEIEVEVPNPHYSSFGCMAYRWAAGPINYGHDCQKPTYTETKQIEVP